jgi:hypothetical protein
MARADSHGLAPESADHAFDVRQDHLPNEARQSASLLYEIIDSSVFVMTIRGRGQDFYDAR